MRLPPLSHHHRLLGMHLASEIPLPDLGPPLSDPVDGPADLTIRLGSLPEELEGADSRRGPYRTRGGAVFFVNAPGVARFQLTAPDQLVVDPIQPPDSLEVLAYLTGSVLGVWFHMRGFLPLHASVLRMGSGAVAFAGRSGAGKSTLAAILSQRGYPLVADDVCVLSHRPGQAPLVMPMPPRVKLTEESQAALPERSLDHGTAMVSGVMGKTLFNQPGVESPLPLRALFILDNAPEGQSEPTLVTPKGVEAAHAVQAVIHRRWMAEDLGLGAQMLAVAAPLPSQIPVRILRRAVDFALLPALVDLIERTLETD